MRVALPIEVKVRDLQGYVWLALHLLERGHEVVLGETASIKNGLDLIEPDVYILPGLTKNPRKINNCRVLNESGALVVTLQTEGGVFPSDQWFRDYLVGERILNYVDIHFAWGARQAGMVSNVSDGKEAEIIVSGHPTFDLLAPKFREVYRDEAEAHIRTYGDYVLFNTNFVYGNHATKSTSSFHPELSSNHSKTLSEYLETIRKLSNDFREAIVVRPHPIEDLSTYREGLSDLPDVHVVRDGNVRPWILGAKVVVHRSSTSGIESALFETPVISYRPIGHNEYDSDLPVLMSDEQDTYEGLRDRIHYYLDNRSYSLSSEQKRQLRSYIHNADRPTATPLITDAIDSLPDPRTVRIQVFERSFEQRVKRIAVRLIGADFTESFGEIFFGTDRSGVRQKVPSITSCELESEIGALMRVADFETFEVQIDPVPSLINTFQLNTVD